MHSPLSVGDWGNIHDVVIGYLQATQTKFQGKGGNARESRHAMMKRSQTASVVCRYDPFHVYKANNMGCIIQCERTRNGRSHNMMCVHCTYRTAADFALFNNSSIAGGHLFGCDFSSLPICTQSCEKISCPINSSCHFRLCKLIQIWAEISLPIKAFSIHTCLSLQTDN